MRPVWWSSEGSRTSGGLAWCGTVDVGVVCNGGFGGGGGYEPIMIRLGEGLLER